MNIKYIYLSVLIILIAGALYLVFGQQSNVDNKLPIPKNDTQTNLPVKPVVQSNQTSEKDVIMDSNKEISKPPIETEKQKVNSSTVTEHKEPQTEAFNKELKVDTSWQSRSIYRNNIEVFYSFGAGNPPEVALSQLEINNLPNLARKKSEVYLTYMTLESEIAMKDFLENQNLPTLLSQCSKEFSLSKDSLSMESIVYIDKNTGRKEFDKNFIDSIGNGLTMLSSPMQPDKWKSCLGEDNKFIYDSVKEAFSNVIRNYIFYATTDKENLNINRVFTPDITDSLPPPGYDTSTNHDNQN